MDEDDTLAMSGDENEEEIKVTRAQELGFEPQKEAELNWLLPNSHELDEESKVLLENIKSHLGRAVMLREMRPACSLWTSRLIKFIRLYGLKFSKEDHIALVKLVYQLILIPDLEPTKLHKFCTLFIMLTKRRYLISPDELVLPWRPFFDLAIKLFYKSAMHIGMVHYMTSLEATCEAVVRCAQPYFEVTATREILDEITPQIIPWDKYCGVLDLLVLFLPVGLRTEHADQGYRLWFDDMLTLWSTCNNSPVIGDLMPLFSGLAKRSPGEIDWSPHVPLMFTRFIHSFNLPVSYKNNQPLQTHSIEINHIANWIVWGMARDGVMMQHLRSFLAGVESYLHSANTGRWSYKLRDFLRKLSRAFLFRVYREKNPKFRKSWENQPKPEFYLREQDIDEFVEILLEPSLLAVHSRFSGSDSGLTLHCLATLRPAVVIPPLLQRLYASLESLTEPHRVTAAMQAIIAVARPLVRGAAAGYPEGPTHVIPILIASLPGLDPNDIRKTMVTLTLISILGSMIPIIDCSNASEFHNDLTEEERIVCEATAQFEDFVLMFLDKIFSIIESSSLEAVRMETRDSESSRTKHDQLLEAGIISASNMVLIQSSPKIILEALRKFKSFATGTTYEIQVAGRHIGWLIRTFLRANAEATVAAFIPTLCEELTDLMSTEEAITDENPPRELLYRLMLLSHIVNDIEIAKYFPIVLPVLDRAMKTHSRKAYTLACESLARIIGPFGGVYINDARSCIHDYAEAPMKWLPIREWGVGYATKNTKFDWHVPKESDGKIIKDLLERYTVPEMELLRSWVNGTEEITKERRMKALSIVNASLSCVLLMPPLDDPPVHLVDSVVPPMPFYLRDSWCRHLTLAGTDVRQAVARLCHDVQDKLVREKSDDTRSLEIIINTWECLCLDGRSWRSAAGNIDGRTRVLATSDRFLDGRGGPRPGSGRLRLTLSQGATFLQQVRVDMRSDAGLGETSIKIMHALLDLSVYAYAEVRMRAQVRLQWMLTHHAFSCRVLLPRLSRMLREPAPALSDDEAHAQLKGVLYLICGGRNIPLAAKQDWDVVRVLWPAVLRAPLSEKPTIIKLEQAFMDTICRHFPTVNTRLTMTAACVEAAEVLVPKEELDKEDFKSALATAEEREKLFSEELEKNYLELIEDLVTIAELPSTMWRRAMYAINLLAMSPSTQTAYPPRAAALFARCLVHENILVRKVAVKLVLFALKQNKQRHLKVEVDPFGVSGETRPDKIIPGYRADNKWVIYSTERVPETDEEWDQPWMHCNVGFYSWPKKIEIYAPTSQQPNAERPLEEMTECQRILYEFFDNDDNVEKLVGYLSAEDKKGKDKFNGFRFSMFKSLFSAYGTPLCRKLLAHALRHAGEAHEASQRFAAEVAAAALRGTKHWRRGPALAIYEDIIEVFRIGLSSVTPESADDWGTCLATAAENLEPHRAAPVLLAWMALCIPQPASGEDADHNADSSFGMSARLLALQGALAALSWRGAALCAEFVSRLQEARFIQHPYQNVRERVGSILMTAFDLDLVFPGGAHGPAPRYEHLLADTLPRLGALYDSYGEIIVQNRAAWVGAPRCDGGALPAAPCSALPRAAVQLPVQAARLGDHTPPLAKPDDDGVGVCAEEAPEGELSSRLEGGLRLEGGAGGGASAHREHGRAINLLITLLRGTVGTIARGVRGAAPAHYELLHAACSLSARAAPGAHDELARAADAYLACMAVVHHRRELFDAALTKTEQVCKSRSWWARLSAVEFAQALLFYSLPLLRAERGRAARAEALALHLMGDGRLEVRSAAAKLLTGLMHCSALADEKSTLTRLMKSCRSKELIERHRGVLGICAYISSRPYTIAPNLGVMLTELLRHTNAPDPMPATIRNTLADFKRTHLDDWQRHRESLTEEELDLLTDLTAPPAYCA